MKLIPLEELPKRKPQNNKIAYVLDEFMAMDAKIVEIDPIAEGYANSASLYGLFHVNIKRYGYPCKAFVRNKKIYLTKL